MDVFEITGYTAGVDQEGVNFLQPSDSFQNIIDGFVYRQVLQSRQGIDIFAPRLANQSRVFGIFENTLVDGSKQILVADRNFLYQYSGGVFTQIPFGGSMAGYAGFNIVSNDKYISGVSYPTASYTDRFVFTSPGITPNAAGSSVFFFDGTNVLDYTSVVDNPNYAPPTMGALLYAKYVLWFNERINFIVPNIAGVTYQQGILYSGIRNTAGNGDKFNVSGSGLLQADTYENITGATILGQILALNFDRSNWIAEKTRDAFNPYFIRKIPSVIGTDADFSAATWNTEVKSLGKTGIINTDGRQSLRVDNKIPFFTQDSIDQKGFNLTYGGFDRENRQFLWAYKELEADTDTQNKVLVNNYEENTWSVFDFRFSVIGQGDDGQDFTWDQIEAASGDESWAQWDTTDEAWDEIGLTLHTQKTLAGDEFGFIYQLNQDYEDYFSNISAITQASQAVLTISAAAFKAGDIVIVSGVEGMTEINNYDENITPDDEDYITQIQNFQPYTIVTATPTSITLNVDSTGFTAATPNTGYVQKLISFYVETIPFNPYRSQGRQCYISHVEFLVDCNGGFLKVDVFEDEEESPFIQDTLILPTTFNKAREWITMTINNEANFMTFVMKQQSPAFQVRITSMRIHCKMGAYTSG